MTTVIFGALLALGLALLVATTVRVLVGGLRGGPDARPGRHEPGGGHARRILEERYAAGELTAEEYQHRLRVLENGAT